MKLTGLPLRILAPILTGISAFVAFLPANAQRSVIAAAPADQILAMNQYSACDIYFGARRDQCNAALGRRVNKETVSDGDVKRTPGPGCVPLSQYASNCDSPEEWRREHGIPAVEQDQNSVVSLDAWVGRSPLERINGKTFYEKVGLGSGLMGRILSTSGFNPRTSVTSVVIRHGEPRNDDIKTYYYLIAYCTIGRPYCQPSVERAEALLSVSVSIWPAGDTNFSYEIWTINQGKASERTPTWCISKGSHGRLPISSQDVDCAKGISNFGWKTNSPIPYKQSGIVYNNDLDDWILSGYKDLSGFNNGAKDLVREVERAISSPSTGHSGPCDPDVRDGNNRPIAGTGCIGKTDHGSW